MRNTKRSERFYREKNQENKETSREKIVEKKVKAKEDTPKRRLSPKERRLRQKRKRKSKVRLLVNRLLIIFIILFLPFFIFEIFVNTPEKSIEKATLAIKDADLENQKKYFDRMDKINKILKTSYSKNTNQQDEFLKANYKNLKIEIKDKKRTREGLVVEVEISNVDYIDVFEKMDVDGKKDVHSQYMNKLKTTKQREKTRAKLILEKKLGHYKIYESRKFVDGILGGALKYAKK